MPTQLQLYNEALSHCQETKLASISENRPSRHALDLHYASALKYLIEQGFWKFAIRAVSITQDTDISPAFDSKVAFNKPSDWVKTYQVSASERFDPPLEDWFEESNLFWADQETIYLRYVSNSEDGYGYDLDQWTGKFQLAFTLELAYRIQPLLPGSNTTKDLLVKEKNAVLNEALSFEAMRDPPRRPPLGKWMRSRFGGRGNRPDWRA